VKACTAPDAAGLVAAAPLKNQQSSINNEFIIKDRQSAISVVAVIINPISGAGRRRDVARRRAEQATAFLHSRRIDGEVFVTERAGHARELARAALGRGVSLCIAWGGDGTVNEVASALAFTPASLAIIPSGSGNGLSRDVGIPFEPQAAFEIAVCGRDRVIDAGEIEGRMFFNLAGVGLDARVAHRFAATGLARRGFIRYLEIAGSEIFMRSPHEYTIAVDGHAQRRRVLLVAMANGRQYGNGALIAPHARIDDGQLDVVVIDDRSPWAVLRYAPKLFRGRLAEVPGVTMALARHIEITSTDPLIYHVDGEPCEGGVSVSARVRPAALRVRVGNLCA
jgi:YegS/Rv2252/BmrU family lipid kinase